MHFIHFRNSTTFPRWSPYFHRSCHIYIYTKVSGSGERLRTGISGFRAFSALGAQNCSKSARARPGPLRAAQNRSERAQSRSESPRAVAQSCSRNRSGSPRARPELVRAAQGRPERAQSCSEPLRIAWSVLRAAQSRSESPRAVAQSCSKNRSGSSVSRALCISDAQ